MKIDLIKGDSLTELAKISDNSADLVFYDPPYNIKKKYDGYDDNLSPHAYIIWMQKVFDRCERISRRGVIVYVASKLAAAFQTYIVPESAHMIIVHKRAAGVFSGNYMLQYHALFSTAKPIIKCKDLWDDVRLPGEGYYFREPRYDHPGLTGFDMTVKVFHHFTKEGETVLDPFVGTGTTAVACKSLGRNCIGIEQSEKYLAIAKKRIENEKQKTN